MTGWIILSASFAAPGWTPHVRKAEGPEAAALGCVVWTKVSWSPVPSKPPGQGGWNTTETVVPDGPGLDPSVASPVSAPAQRILVALGDPTALRVLANLSKGERDAHTVVVETGLPQSSVYRKLRELTEDRIVYIHRLAFTREGRKVELFRSRLGEVRVRLVGGNARVDIVFRQDPSDRIDEMWDEVQRFAR